MAILSPKLNPTAGASQGRPQSAIASYVWGPDLGSKPFARRDWQAAGGVRGLILANYFTGANGGGLHAPGMDAMGNVTSVTRLGLSSYSGGPYFRNEFVYDYDAFGKEMRSSTLVAGLNPDSFPFHYSTKFTDPESGFNYYGYRFYDPANGRWINRDPICEEGGVNLYGMVGNDSMNIPDKLGLDECDDLVKDVTKPCGKKTTGGKPLTPAQIIALAELCRSSSLFHDMLKNFSSLAALRQDMMLGILGFDSKADFDKAHPGLGEGVTGLADLNGMDLVTSELGTMMGTFVHEMTHLYQNAAYESAIDGNVFKSATPQGVKDVLSQTQNSGDKPGVDGGPQENQAIRAQRIVRNQAAESKGFLKRVGAMPSSPEQYYPRRNIPGMPGKSIIR